MPIFASVGASRLLAFFCSAGALDAFERLVKGLPADTGAAYVFLQHMDPEQKSLLTELLSKVSPVYPVQSHSLRSLELRS